MSDPPAAESELELENFRRRWKEEVSARSAARPSLTSNAGPIQAQSNSRFTGKGKPLQLPSGRQHTDEAEGRNYHDLPDREEQLKLGATEKGLARHDASTKEPSTALEHYEKAVENEAAGKLGESLNLYRRAFKLDDRVHEKYKNKHFPPSAQSTKPTQPNPSNAAATVSGTAHHSLHGLTPSLNQLLQDFASLTIAPIEPPTDASPQPPCPIATMPGEIVAQILTYLALDDISAYAKLALVCKRFAYLVMTDEQIWKAVNYSTAQGFGSMLYTFACDIYGQPQLIEDKDEDNGEPTSISVSGNLRSPQKSDHLLAEHYLGSWRQMYRMRPRIRFHGVYISTVNYTRPGGASATVSTWSTPIHVVTYFRYLRFFRDGTCISLLTTAEPLDVVHVLTKENMPENSTDPAQPRRTRHVDRSHVSKPPPTSLEKAGSSHAQWQKTDQPHALPSSQIMKDALRGRWRLSGPDGGPGNEAEGDLHVETEGVVPKYMFKMQFAMGHLNTGPGAHAAGSKRGSRNNRLIWRGFWSYNRLTDDWAEFGRKHDRPYFFSRVKSYGMGMPGM